MPRPPRVFREPDARKRRELQEALTRKLPEWFGKAEANVEYAHQAERLDGYIAEIDGENLALLLLKWTSPSSAEVYWMGVDPARHRNGIGHALIDAATIDARARGAKYLFVATLHPDVSYEPYQRTRRFYEAEGFHYVLEEQFPADPGNPLAIYLKDISQ